jgi:hypothetical protein
LADFQFFATRQDNTEWAERFRNNMLAYFAKRNHRSGSFKRDAKASRDAAKLRVDACGT